MALSYKNDSDQDERLNPSSDTARDLYNQEHDAIEGYDRNNDGLDDHPVSAGDASGKSGDNGEDNTKNIDDVKDQESEGGGHINNFTGGGKSSGKFDIRGLGKRKSMVAFLISIFAIGGIGIGGFFGVPGLLIVNIAEVMTEKFDVQLGSMNVRYGKIVQSKVSNTTSGICTSVASIQCKYSSLSDKQIKKFKLAGIEVQHTGGTTYIRGKTKPTMFIFEGKEISAANFAKETRTNMKFRAAVKQSYNPKLAGFADKVFAKAANKLKISKKAPFAETDTTDDDRTRAIKNQTQNGLDTSSARKIQPGELKEDGTAYTDPEREEHNRNVDSSNAIGSEADRVAKGGVKAGDVALSAGVNAVKITGTADAACMVYGMITAVSYGAKVIRAAQMARYAMIFLTTASMIKAGEARPGDVTYVGNILTKVTEDKPKAATDSDGYQYAANMRTGPVGNNATQYLSGGGLGGQFVDVMATINLALNNNPKGTCKTLANPFVQAGSFIAGIALFFLPGGAPLQATKMVGTATLMIVTAAAVAILPGMLADIAAGVIVDDTTGGEDAGNIIASGSSAMMGTVANMGGNAPLTPAQAAAYENGVIVGAREENAEEDRLAHSPFDPTSTSTFMGQLYTKLAPHTTQLASLTGILSTSASLVGSSLSTITAPASKAVTAEDFTHCQDEEYRRLGIATDPFCNPYYGIPTKYINGDPIEITNRLADQIDPETGNALPGSELDTFVKDCIERDRPLGDSGVDFTQDDGSKCLINESNADFYVHTIDQRILDGMDNGYNDGADATSTTGVGPNSGFVNPNGWTFPTTKGTPLGSAFGPRDGAYHTGIDLNIGAGSPFYATRDGVIETRQYSVYTIMGDGGAWCPVLGALTDPNQKDIWIRHTVDGEKYTSVYGHMSRYLKKTGDTVKAGELIGYTGSSGCSSGPHVHFEIWKGEPTPSIPGPGMLDPWPLINQ